MPEGPEIRRAADNLEAAIKGKPLTDVWFAFAQLKPYESQLTGQIVTRIETRGKALLTHFSNGLTLYSHNQLYGVWRVIDTGEIPQTTRILRVRLQTADKTILLYSASDIEMLTAEQLTTHPFYSESARMCWTRVSLRKRLKLDCCRRVFATDNFPGCCWISPFWRDWGIICALKSSGR